MFQPDKKNCSALFQVKNGSTLSLISLLIGGHFDGTVISQKISLISLLLGGLF